MNSRGPVRFQAHSPPQRPGFLIFSCPAVSHATGCTAVLPAGSLVQRFTGNPAIEQEWLRPAPPGRFPGLCQDLASGFLRYTRIYSLETASYPGSTATTHAGPPKPPSILMGQRRHGEARDRRRVRAGGIRGPGRVARGGGVEGLEVRVAGRIRPPPSSAACPRETPALQSAARARPINAGDSQRIRWTGTMRIRLVIAPLRQKVRCSRPGSTVSPQAASTPPHK